MLLEWFNAREVTEAATVLADQFAQQTVSGSATRGTKAAQREQGKVLQELLRRTDREIRPLRLNLYKRAKFANTFKWRLLERGVQEEIADDTTRTLVLNLSLNQAGSAQGHNSAAAPTDRPDSSKAKHLLALGHESYARGAYAEAVTYYHELVGIKPPRADTLNNLGAALCKLGRYQEAADISRQILALRGKTIPDTHPSIAASLQTLGRCEDKLGDTASGRRSLEESIALRRKVLPPDSWLIASSEGFLADHFIFVKQYGKAETLSLDAYGIMTKALGPQHPKTQVAVSRLVGLYEASGRPDKAAEFKAKLTAPPA